MEDALRGIGGEALFGLSISYSADKTFAVAGQAFGAGDDTPGRVLGDLRGGVDPPSFAWRSTFSAHRFAFLRADALGIGDRHVHALLARL